MGWETEKCPTLQHPKEIFYFLSVFAKNLDFMHNPYIFAIHGR